MREMRESTVCGKWVHKQVLRNLERGNFECKKCDGDEEESVTLDGDAIDVGKFAYLRDVMKTDGEGGWAAVLRIRRDLRFY